LTEDGEICSWNAAAQRLFGYPADEVLGRNIDDVLEARDAPDTSAVAGGAAGAGRCRLRRDSELRSARAHRVLRMVDAARQLVSLTQETSHHAPVEPLSDQERRMLKLFATGSNAKTIAGKLNIPAQTPRNHLHHINRKLRTHNRLEAVTHAQHRGLID
jgi:ATP/maltotriose-dependent transcriptional regulator MalT